MWPHLLRITGMMATKKSPSDASPALQVKKAVEAIAINPKTGRVTLLTRKLFNVLLRHAQEQNQEQGQDLLVYRAALSDITSDASFDSKDTFLIKEHLRKMNTIQVEWNSTNQDGNRRWGVTNLVGEAEIIEDRKARRTWVEWSYSPKIKKRLLEPEIYARLAFQFMSELRSNAAYALYEICARYASSPGHLSMRQPWEWWRPVLTGQPDGAGETFYEYKYFKRDVLKGAIAEVNSITDIEVELIEHKSGRKIVDIQFTAKKKKQAGLPLPRNGLFDMSLVAKMMALGLPQREVEQIYVDTEENIIRSALDSVDARMANRKLAPLENAGAYFKTVLKSGLTKKAALPKPKQATKRVTTEKIRERYMAHQTKEARALYGEMNKQDQSNLNDQFMTFIEASKNKVLMDEYQKKGLKSKIAETSFFSWLAEQQWGQPTEKDLLEFVLDGNAGLS